MKGGFNGLKGAAATKGKPFTTGKWAPGAAAAAAAAAVKPGALSRSPSPGSIAA